MRTSEVSEEELREWVAEHPSIPLSHPAELKLAKAILKLSDAVLNVLDTLLLHQVGRLLKTGLYFKKCVKIDLKPM